MNTHPEIEKWEDEITRKYFVTNLITGSPAGAEKDLIEDIHSLLTQERTALVEEIEKKKTEHDIEKDPSGAFSVCLICGEGGVSSGDKCETAYNLGLSDAQALISKETV